MRERVALSAASSTPGRATGGGFACAQAAGCRRVSIRVLIADDQALVRTGFRMILEAEPDIEVVGEAADGGEAVERAPRCTGPTSS